MCRLVTPPDFCNASESCNRVVGLARRGARAARLCNDCFGNVPDFPPLLPVLYR